MLGNYSRRPFALSSLLMMLHVLQSVQVPVLQPQCAMLVGRGPSVTGLAHSEAQRDPERGPSKPGLPPRITQQATRGMQSPESSLVSLSLASQHSAQPR